MTGLMTPEGRWWAALILAGAWKSAAVLAGAGLVCLTLRRAAAATRHLVWFVALAGALTLLPLSIALPPWSWHVLPSVAGANAQGGTITVVPGWDAARIPVASESERAQGEDPAGIARDTPAGRPEAKHPASLNAAALPRRTREAARWPAWVWALGAWVGGAALVLAGLVLGRLALRQAARGAVVIRGGDWAELVGELSAVLKLRHRVTLLLSDRAVMPMTWGWLRPVVLLPAEAGRWEPGRRRDVLLHELAHIRRADCLTQAVAQLACAVYWFNPLAWLAAVRMRVERERACDDLVLVSGSRASDYAEHLLRMARELRSHRASALAAVAMARRSQLEGRLRSILDPHRRRVGPGRVATTLALAAVAALVLPLSAVRLNTRAAANDEGGKPVTHATPEARGTMTVMGRVLDPDGRPVKGAAVDLVGRPNVPWVGAAVDDENHVAVLGQAETDGDGRFRFVAPRTSSKYFSSVTLLAAAPGFGLGWARLNPDAEQPEAEVRLHPEQTVRVTLVDVTGLPVRGVEVRTQSFGRPKGPASFEGVYLGQSAPETLRAWPQPAVTDDQGCFRLTGIGRDFRISLDVRDLRFARQYPEVKTTAPEAILALEPARIIEGHVVAADTGVPIPDAIIAAAARIQNENANGYFTTKFRADVDGRFRINPMASDEYSLHAFPPEGEPYLIAQGEVRWVKGAVRTTHNFRLRRGVVIRGRVSEEGSGRPLPDSSVQFLPIGAGRDVLSGWQAIVASGDDGTYQIAVPPGRGHLLVFGPTSDYVQETISERMLYSSMPGGRRYYAHKVLAYDVKPDAGTVILDAPLRPGKTVTLRVTGPGGQAVNDALYLTTLHRQAINPFWRGDSEARIKDGQFELRGIAPGSTARVDILDDEHGWGASVEVSAEQAGIEVPVTLLPCGRARTRFLGPVGRPLEKHMPQFEYLATPGPHGFARDQKDGELVADSEFMANVDRKHYWEDFLTDAEGRITFSWLIPGARYRICDVTTISDPEKGVQVRKDFTVQPGETLDLGDILIEKPQG